MQLHLAQAFAAAGNAADAKAAAQKALAIDPAFPEAGEARAIVEGRGKPTSSPRAAAQRTKGLRIGAYFTAR